LEYISDDAIDMQLKQEHVAKQAKGPVILRPVLKNSQHQAELPDMAQWCDLAKDKESSI
jgi:hypothetical protein